MAYFYGTISTPNVGVNQVSKSGTKESGITSTVATYITKVSTTYFHNKETGEDTVKIHLHNLTTGEVIEIYSATEKQIVAKVTNGTKAKKSRGN